MPRSRRVRALLVGCVLLLVVGITSLDYTVQKGDTLGKIARDQGVSVSDLVEANGISNPNLIYPGQVLVIPGQPGKSKDVVHVVSRGETLTKIASQYGSTVGAIAKANDLPNPDLIRIGQELLVPGATSGSSGGSGSSGSSGGSGSGGEGDGGGSSAKTSLRSGKHHIVARGESVGSIAAKYSGVSADDITKANGIVGGIIYAGTRLFLDGPSVVAKGSTEKSSYTVRSGDRLADIAASHGVSLSQLIAANDISNPNLIRPGQTLVIPKGSAWMCPVEGARFFNDWGFPREGGARYHEGNDLFVARGTPVHAPVSGRVEFVTGTIGGLQFRLYGDDGIKYIGSHMNEFGKGGRVSAGDVVGYVGTTGNAAGTSPHLHFGMYYKDTVVNPYPSLIANGCG